MARPQGHALTKRIVDRLSVDGKDAIFWDRDLPGFGVRVYPDGRKLSVVQTRAFGRSKRVTIRGYRNEVFAMLYLDCRHRVIAFEETFSGTVDGKGARQADYGSGPVRGVMADPSSPVGADRRTSTAISDAVGRRRKGRACPAPPRSPCPPARILPE